MPSRMRVYRSEAVVLRRRDFGEADRLLTVLTPERGKLRLVAKGARRPKSRKAGHLEPFTRVMLLMAKGRELDLITQAEAMQSFATLRSDLERLSHAAYVAELTDQFAVEEERSPALYNLLLTTLEQLEAGEAPGTVLRYFELRLLDLAGYRPELSHCPGCGKEIQPEKQFFSPAKGGVLCPNCGSGEARVRPISLAALRVLRHFQRSPYAVAAAVTIRPAVHSELEQIMQEYVAYLLEHKLNSPEFIRRVRELNASTYGRNTRS